MQKTPFVALGGLLAALAVALGAVGAHVLESRLSPRAIEVFRLAVHYQMLSAFGLVLAGGLNWSLPSRWFRAAGWILLAGMLLFSGGLMAWLASNLRPLMFVVPIGGTLMIVGWVALAVGGIGFWRVGRPNAPVATSKEFR